MGLRIEDRRIAVGVLERLREDVRRQPVHLVEYVPRGLRVQFGVRSRAQDVLAAEHLEKVELQVPEVAPVMPHGRDPLFPTSK
jgi:hypothetical protein